MIGPRAGVIVGVRAGVAAGVGADQIANDSAVTSLTVTLNDSADPVAALANFDYTSVVTNLTAGTLNNVSAVITLHSSLTFVSGSGTGWTVNAVGQVVTATRATLATGAAPTITVTVTAGALSASVTSTADATADLVTPAVQAFQTTTIQAAASTTLSVAISDSADPVNISTNFNYTTVVTNTGAVTATSVSAVVTLDASLTFVSGSGTGWVVSAFGQVVTCTRASLAVGAAPTITVTVTAGGSAITASSTADANAGNASPATQSTQTTRIRATTTLTLALTDSADPVNVSTNYSYAAIVTNAGAATAENVTAVVVLDASLTFVSGSGTGWTVNNASGTVTCTRATLTTGAAPTVTITVTAGASAVTASSNLNASADNAAAATQSTQTTRIRALTTLTVALTDATDPVITAVNFAYSFVVTNTGSADAETVSAPVVLDASLVFVSGSGTGWTVSHSAGTVSCTRAILVAGAAPTITITVTTGGSALTASSNGNASAANASAATQSTQTTVVKLVTKDATSGIRCPESITQWTDFVAYHVAIGTANFPNIAPSHSYTCQEASGNLIDQGGSMNLTAAGTPLYSQAVTGWTRVGVGFNGGTAQRFSVASGTGPNPASTPVAMLVYFTMRTISGTREVVMISDAGSHRAVVFSGATGLLTTTCDATNNAGTVDHRDSAAHPLMLTYDAAGTVNRYTDIERDDGTFAAGTTDGVKGIGAPAGTGSYLGEALLFTIFQGTNAQLTALQVKTLYQTLGWSPPWAAP